MDEQLTSKQADASGSQLVTVESLSVVRKRSTSSCDDGKALSLLCSTLVL